MSDLAETFQNDISQLFNERGLLRTELIAKEKLLTEAIVQKNALNQSLKQSRIERDELFSQNQKLKQEKLAAEAEKSASTIHVTILKEEKTLLEEKLYSVSQQFEQARLQIEKLTRDNHILQHQPTHSSPSPIHHFLDHRKEFEDLKKRQTTFEQSQENLHQRHQEEIQIFKNELNAKDEQIEHLHRLIGEYEQTISSKEKIEKDLQQRLDEIRRSGFGEKLTLSDEERRTIETDPNCASILKLYRSSKSLFDILVDFSLLQKQNESLMNEKEKFNVQQLQNENMIHQLRSDLQQLRVQNDRHKFLAENRQNEYEQAIRDKQTLFKEKNELEKQFQQKQRELDDCLDDRLNMRAQIFHLLEQENLRSHSRSLPTMIDEEVLSRQGVVTFQNFEELYEQYMKTLAEIRETDRFIAELEETHAKELKEITQREFLLKENLEQVRDKLEQTRTDFNIQTLAKQVLDRENQRSLSKPATNSTQIQTDIDGKQMKIIDENLQHFQKQSNDKDFQINRLNEEIKLIEQKFQHAQKQNVDDKRKIEDLQRLFDETLQRNKNLLADVHQSELLCEQLREEKRQIQYDHDRISSTVSSLKSEIERIEIEKQQISQLQEQVLDRIKNDIESRISQNDENLINVKLKESVDELNSIMKDCVKQTELTSGTSAHVTSLTKLEILYRQLQQRHQYDLEQHFAISESLKIKAKDAQKTVEKLERQYEEMRVQFQEEQSKSAAKINELEMKLRNADTTTVLTRLLPSATLENRLKEEEERTQQLRTWTNKLTEKIENIQKQMASDKKEYEDKMDTMQQELRESRNERDLMEKRYQTLTEEHEKSLRDAKEKEETFEMEIYKLKTELDSAQISQQVLREAISNKEDQLRLYQERIIDYENKLTIMEKELLQLKEKYARHTKEHNLPISEPPSPCVVQAEITIEEATSELKTPSKRRRLGSSNDRTPGKARVTRSQSVDCSSTLIDNEELADDNDDAMSTCSEPPSAKKRKRRAPDANSGRLPAVNEEGDHDDSSNDAAGSGQTPTYNLRSRTKKLTKLEK